MLRRTGLDVTVAAAVLAAGLFLAAAAQAATLTGGTWQVKGSDTSGAVYDGSALVFTSQTVDGDDFAVAGYFDWVSNGISTGQSLFTGTYFSYQLLSLAGPPPAGGSVLAIFTADVDLVGNQIAGNWAGPDIAAGTFSASRTSLLQAVPLPAALPLVLTGLAALLFTKRRRPS